MREFNLVEDTKHHRSLIHVPSKFTRIVCMCPEPGPPLFDPEKRPSAISCCRNCMKPYRWYIRRCTACNEWFIKDFRRQQFDCVRHTKCYDCIEALGTWKHIPVLGMVMLLICECPKENSGRVDFGPLSFNPRKVSKEEMDAALPDLPSVFD